MKSEYVIVEYLLSRAAIKIIRMLKLTENDRLVLFERYIIEKQSPLSLLYFGYVNMLKYRFDILTQLGIIFQRHFSVMYGLTLHVDVFPVFTLSFRHQIS